MTIRLHASPPAIVPVIDPSTTGFIVVSFEGPDRYSRVGSLGLRVTRLVEALASHRFETHLFFMGDPLLPGEEAIGDDHLVLHRWAQWISEYCPGGVYEGEEARVADVTSALPPYIVEHLVLPLIAINRPPILLFEEWQTAECACRVADLVREAGLARRPILVWNASSVHGFDRIDWRRLATSAIVTTSSRTVNRAVRSHGVNVRFASRLSRELAFAPSRAKPVRQARARTPHRAADESPSQAGPQL